VPWASPRSSRESSGSAASNRAPYANVGCYFTICPRSSPPGFAAVWMLAYHLPARTSAALRVSKRGCTLDRALCRLERERDAGVLTGLARPVEMRTERRAAETGIGHRIGQDLAVGVEGRFSLAGTGTVVRRHLVAALELCGQFDTSALAAVPKTVTHKTVTPKSIVPASHTAFFMTSSPTSRPYWRSTHSG
jgi:hypothetical protein